MSLFPAYINDEGILDELEPEKHRPREYGIDLKTGQLTGEIVEGEEAIEIWIWLALKTARYRYYIYTWDYGNELDGLIGQSYTEKYVEAETKRMVEECLLINEDIQSISDFSAKVRSDRLIVSFTANTIYGEIEFQNQAVVGRTA